MITFPRLPFLLPLVGALLAAPGLAPLAAQETAAAPAPLRVTAIPDEAPTELQRKFAPLGAYLEKKLELEVEFTPVTDYAAAVEALVNGKVDLAWFGGFTFVQARTRSKNQVIPLVQRAEDEKFRSVFIARADSGIEKLEDLAGKDLTFGSPSSTSGHLMPRSFLLEAKLDPEKNCKRVAFSGAHDATIAAVAGGKVDAGALNISVWEKFVAEKRVDPEKVRVFYTTPPYYDYNWTVRADMPEPLRKKIADAFLALDPKQEADKAILDLQRASKFIPTKSENYDAIEKAAKGAGLLENEK